MDQVAGGKPQKDSVASLVYIDNGFANRLSKDKFVLDFFFEREGQETLLITPFSFIESIGLKIRNYDIPASNALVQDIKNSEDTSSTIGYFDNHDKWVCSKIKKELNNDKNFTLQNIEKLQKEKLQRVHPSVKRQWPSLFLIGKLDQGHLDTIKKEVVLDRCFSHKFKEGINREVDSYYLGVMAFDIVIRNSNFPFGRVATNFWKGLTNYVSTKDPGAIERKRKYIERITKNCAYKRGRDLMDTELIHLSTVGHYSQGKRKPVHCYTFDDYKKIEDRIALYKSILRCSFDGVISEAERLGNEDLSDKMKTYSFAEGKVTCFEKSNIRNFKTLEINNVASVFQRLDSDRWTEESDDHEGWHP